MHMISTLRIAPRHFHFFVFCLALIPIQVSAQFDGYKGTLTLHRDWKFAKGQHDDAYRVDFDDSAWETVMVPHDWAIAGPFIPDGDGNTGKLPWKGEGWYRYNLYPSPVYKGRNYYLLFDGVMAFPTVYVNGQLAGRWDYGYNSFYVDVTDLIKQEQYNTIAVHVDTRMHDSRWYPGAGIYRKVQFIAADPIHIELWGEQVTTPIVKPNYAKVNVITKVLNRSEADADLTVEHILKSPQGRPIDTMITNGKILAGGSRAFESTLTLPDPDRWDIGHGVLYYMVTYVKQGTKLLDTGATPFGVRTMRFTPDDGFYLNDRRVQLKGVNLHHDLGPLGAAQNNRALERQLMLLTEMGCNAIRTSHNAPAPELVAFCDQMGILLIDELFDKYDRKADILDTTDFDAFVERNVRNFIMRDRNSPSIFLWSVGNEIGDVQWNINGGFSKLRKMVSEVRKYDSTRPVTLVCDSRNSAALRHFDFYDVHSWNYGRRYDLARQLEPNKAVIISESASTVSTRGFYEWPLPGKKTDFTKSLQVSSYDLHAPEWAEISDDDFMWQQEEPYVAGEFVWTGFDYLGEPTPYDPSGIKKLGLPDSSASVSSYFGIFDLVGLPKDRYYLYKSYWNNEDTTIHILPHWTWPGMEGKNIPVFVYTSGDCAELFLNGVSRGRRCKIPDSPNSTERFRLMWNEVTYMPGELKVVAYEEGQNIGEAIVRTAGKPYQLKLTVNDPKDMNGGGLDLRYVTVEALDKNGNFCPTADAWLDLNLTGPGSIAGVGNGDPQSTNPFQSNRVRLFYGKAVIILRSGNEDGILTLTTDAQGLQRASMSFNIAGSRTH